MGKKDSPNTQGYRFLQDVLPDLDFVTNKLKSAKAYYTYFLNRCLEMFEYKNLPDSIPHEILDKYLMINGIACITKGPEEDVSRLRVFYGNLGGIQDCYYRPTKFIIANPHFKQTFSKECVVLGDLEEHDGVLMRNDSSWFGLHAMLSRYACLLAENTLTLRVADIMLRITALLSAPSDKERASALDYLRSLSNGELGVISENPFFEGIKLQSPPSNNGSYLTQFIEYQQYLKGSFYNEVGLSANYNMKREAIGKGESTLDQDALLPLCENMLKVRREDFQKVNEMFGTNIEVDFSSAWLENALQDKLILLSQSKEAGLTPEKGDEVDEKVQTGGEDETTENGEINGDESQDSDLTDSPNSADSANSTESSAEEEDTEKDVSRLIDSDGGGAELGNEESSGDDLGQAGSSCNDLSQNATLDKVQDALDEALSTLEVDSSKGGDEFGFGDVQKESDSEGDIPED